MAYITGLTPLGCSLPSRYIGNGVYECAPDVGDFHRRHRIYNDYHLWYIKIIGKKGEKVTVRLNWPEFDPDAVSDEYKAWDSYSADWPPFFTVLKEALYYSTDELVWNRITDAYEDGNAVVFSLILPADNCYVCTTLRYSIASFDDLIRLMEKSPCSEVVNLGKGWDGGDLISFVATDFSVPISQKYTIYIQAMQHCHESPGAHVCDFMLRFLAGGSEKAKELLSRYIFRITPVVDMSGWRTGREIHPARLETIEFNMNRDWGVFDMTETRAIAEYLDKLAENGERFAFLADLHGGTGYEEPEISGANGIFLEVSGSQEEIEMRKKFIDMVRLGCDYMNPEDTEYWECINENTMFSAFVQKFAPAFSFEIAQSKMWDRKAGKRLPNTQAGYKRLAEQLLVVIDEFCRENGDV